MRIGLVSPYSFDVPGGVQAHVGDLARHLRAVGHEATVLAPADEGRALPDFVVPAGRAVPIRYNGSTARLLFGPVAAARVARWLEESEVDLLHIHEPLAPSLSLLALWAAEVPVVATFHSSTTRSRALHAAHPLLRPGLEKIHGRIAVSEAARQTVRDHIGGDAVIIPNGVDTAAFARAVPAPEWRGTPGRPVLAFLGRIDEPRKGLSVLTRAMPRILEAVPGARLLVIGPGDAAAVRARMPEPVAAATEFLGTLSDEAKATALASADLYVAPHTGGESFGIVLVEAMAAGTAVLASDLDAFRRVLRDGECGQLFATGRSESLADHLVALLEEHPRRADLVARATEAVEGYDWPVVCTRVLRVYETVRAPGEKVRVSGGARFRDVARASRSGGRGRSERGER